MLTGYAKKIKILVNQLEEYTLKEIPIRFAHFLLREMKKQHTISSIETFIELKVSKTVNCHHFLVINTKNLIKGNEKISKRWNSSK